MEIDIDQKATALHAVIHDYINRHNLDMTAAVKACGAVMTRAVVAQMTGDLKLVEGALDALNRDMKRNAKNLCESLTDHLHSKGLGKKQ